MARRWVQPFNETLLWTAVGMSCASVVVMLVGGGLSELLGNKPMFWLSALVTGGLSAPCAGMVIAADTCPPGDDPMSRSTHGFVVGCSVLGGCIVGAVELLRAFA